MARRTRESLCYGCTHFSISLAQGAYSDQTPGSDWSMTCGHGVWDYDAYLHGVDKFKACLEMALTCKDWSPRVGEVSHA